MLFDKMRKIHILCQDDDIRLPRGLKDREVLGFAKTQVPNGL